MKNQCKWLPALMAALSLPVFSNASFNHPKCANELESAKAAFTATGLAAPRVSNANAINSDQNESFAQFLVAYNVASTPDKPATPLLVSSLLGTLDSYGNLHMLDATNVS